MPEQRSVGYAYCLLAGACDALTGLLLVATPLATLKLMNVTSMPVEPVYVRFIGAFVGSVGLTYLSPFLRASGPARDALLRGVLESTAVVRVAIALFVGVSVLRSVLTPGWLLVCFTDAALAAVQIALLRKGVLADAR